MINWIIRRLTFAGMLAALALAAVYAVILGIYSADIPHGSDQCSMFATARFLLDSGVFHYREFINMEFTGNFWVINNPLENRVFSVYPPGLALCLAAWEWLGGAGAQFYFSIFCAGGSVFLLYLLARFFLPAGYALLAAFILASCPALFLNAQIQNTHAAGVFCTLGGIIAMLRAARSPGAAGVWGWGALCGLLFGYIVALRYPDGLLLIVPVVYGLAGHHRKIWKRRRWAAAGAYVLGAAVPGLFLAWYHWMAFGSPLRTGYSLFNAAAGGFSPLFLPDNLWLYLPGLINHAFGPAAFLGLAVLAVRRFGKLWGRWVWAAWILPLFFLYHFYFWAAPDNYHLTLRFYLNIIPGMILLGVISLRQILRQAPRRTAVLAVVILTLWQALWSLRFTGEVAEAIYKSGKEAEMQAAFVRENIPAGAVIFFSPNPKKEEKFAVESLFACHRWHFFSTLVFEMEEMQKKARADLQKRREDLGGERKGADTFQQDRITNLFNAAPEKMFAEFMNKLQSLVKNGAPLYYFGDAETLPAFQNLAKRWLEIGEPIRGINAPLQYLWLQPRSNRYHNIAAEKRQNKPDMLAVPLKLR